MKNREKLISIKKAIKITEAGMRSARRHLQVGITEKMLAAEIEYSMRRAGAEWYSFPTIISSGRHKNIHAMPTNKKICRSDTVIVDIGAQVNGYCTDITRTFCLSPKKENTRLYNLVKQAQAIVEPFLKPRVKARVIDKIARSFLAKQGFKIPHSLGHGIGKRTHERPLLKPRSRDKLKVGDIITIEPGIYFHNHGYRIEDMYLITKLGAKKLTNFSKRI